MAIKIAAAPTLSDAQKFMSELRDAMKWESTGPENMMLMAEELGEVAKEVRKLHWNKANPEETKEKLGHELVDVLNYICAIANTYEVDLEKSYQEKCEIIVKRLALV